MVAILGIRVRAAYGACKRERRESRPCAGGKPRKTRNIDILSHGHPTNIHEMAANPD